MSPSATQLIRHTFGLLENRAGIVSLLFYQRLFQIAPETRPMFINDIEAQGVKLMQMLRTVTTSLDALESVAPMLAEMGQRHTTYGVVDEHYDLVGKALLETFADVLGKDFTAGARNAWADAYDWIAQIMKQGAAETRKAMQNPSASTHSLLPIIPT
jgi:hemoglobin-like flavoprotein